MAEGTLEYVKRYLDLEASSDELHQLPADFYLKVAQYSQRLRRTTVSGNSEAVIRLVARQTEMLNSMVRQLLALRVEKGAKQEAFVKLLPEERYVCSAKLRSARRFDIFVDAVSSGQPSFIEYTNKRESARSTPVRFVKHVDEIIGADLRRYGPFESNDVASIPSSTADVLIAAGSAIEILTRDDS